MSANPSPYDAAIEQLENQIRHFQSILDSLRMLRTGSDGSPLPFSSGGSRESETEVRHDTFFGMTIGDAAKKYLAMVKATKSTSDIAEALERGGLKHSSKDFSTTVRSILGPREDFTRVPNGDWGLSEWYPGQGRGKKPKPEKPVKAKAAGKPKKAGRVGGMTRKEKVLNVMQADPTKAWTAGDVANALGDERRLIQTTMSVLAKDGLLAKDATEGYRLPKAA